MRSSPTAAQIAVIRSFDFLIAARWPAAITLTVWTAVPYLAGRDTKAVFLVLFREIGSFDAVLWVLAGFAMVWAFGERWIRRRSTSYLAARIRNLEAQARSSSVSAEADQAAQLG